jgi:hypothetical protein
LGIGIGIGDGEDREPAGHGIGLRSGTHAGGACAVLGQPRLADPLEAGDPFLDQPELGLESGLRMSVGVGDPRDEDVGLRGCLLETPLESVVQRLHRPEFLRHMVDLDERELESLLGRRDRVCSRGLVGLGGRVSLDDGRSRPGTRVRPRRVLR